MAQQKNRKTYLIQTFGIPAELLAQAQATRKMRNDNALAEPLNMSQWIVRAIRREIAHAERSRKKKVASPANMGYTPLDNVPAAE